MNFMCLHMSWNILLLLTFFFHRLPKNEQWTEFKLAPGKSKNLLSPDLVHPEVLCPPQHLVPSQGSCRCLTNTCSLSWHPVRAKSKPFGIQHTLDIWEGFISTSLLVPGNARITKNFGGILLKRDTSC